MMSNGGRRRRESQPKKYKVPVTRQVTIHADIVVPARNEKEAREIVVRTINSVGISTTMQTLGKEIQAKTTYGTPELVKPNTEPKGDGSDA